MWTEITLPKYDREKLRYASDLTDDERKLIEPHLPAAQALGRPRMTDLRDVVNAVLYVLRSGCPWRLLPKGFPPRSTVQRYFAAWRDEGLWIGINHALPLPAKRVVAMAQREQPVLRQFGHDMPELGIDGPGKAALLLAPVIPLEGHGPSNRPHGGRPSGRRHRRP